MRLAYVFLLAMLSFELEAKPRDLAYVQLRVENEIIHLKAGEVLKIAEGDRLELLGATLENGSSDVGYVNFVGFRPVPSSSDDRFQVLGNLSELDYDWAHNRSESVFRVNVRSKDYFHGRVYIKFLEAELKKLKVSIDGEPRSLMPGDSLKVSQLESIKLVDFVSNIRNPNATVRYVFEAQTRRANEQRYLLVFYRQNQRLASFPIIVEESSRKSE